MSDNLKLSVRVDAQDDASPKIRKLMSEVRAFQKLLGKSFGSISTKSDFGASSIRAAAANHRALNSVVLQANREQIAGLKFRAKVERTLQKDRARDAAATAKSQERAERDGIRAIAQTIRAAGQLAKRRAADDQQNVRAAARNEAAELRSIRARMAFTSRMARQRLAEEQAVAREAVRGERDRAAAARESIRIDRYRIGLRARYERDQDRDRRSTRTRAERFGRDALSRARDSYGTLTRTGAGAGLAAAGTGAIVRRSLGVEMDADAAEVNARIYAGLSKQAARDIRQKWAEPLAEQLGTGTEKLLTGYTDAIKLGIPSEGAKAFAGLTVKTSEAWSVSIENVSETLGTINTLLTSTGEKFDFDKIKSVANTLQYLAAKQATTPEKMISFLERGAGAAQVLGMSQEAGLAFGSASTSLGNQAGKSGSLFDYIAGRIIELPKLTKKQGDTGKEAREIVRALGFGSADAMDRQRRADPDAFLPDLLERFNKISNPKIQERVIRNFAGQEWFGEFGRMAKGSSTYKEASQLAKEAQKLDAIGEVWDLHRTKLVFVAKQFSAGWRNILGEFGKVLSPIARQVGDEFLKWSAAARSGGLAARIRASIEGFVNGLGFRSVPDLLKGILGDPGDTSGGAISAWKSTFHEFAAGLKDVFTAIKSVVSTFAGGDPEVMARWAGRTVALTSALLLLSPVVGVITALATGIIALSAALRGAGALLTALGLGKAAAPASPAATATPGLLGRLGSLLGIAGSAAAPVLTIDPSKADQDAMMLRLGAWARRKNGESTGTWTDPPAKNLKDAIEENTKVLKQSFDGGSGIRSLIHKASFDGADVREIKQAFSAQGARLQLASLTSGTTGGLASSGGGSFGGGSGATGALGGTGAGSMLGNTPGQAFGGGGSRRGILGSGGARGAGAPNENFTGSNADVLKQAAASLGVSPKDLATVISYETMGKFSPSISGGKGGRYQGLIQFGPAERAKYGVTGKETFAEQMPKVVRFLKDRGLKPGMGLNQLYATINGGNPNISQNASDGNGTIASHVDKMQREHGARADAFLNSGSGGLPSGSAASGLATSSVGAMAGQSAPGNIKGSIDLDGEIFKFGSGGNKGSNSIPFGTHEITPGTIGPWGQAHGALGINNNAIWDKSLGRMRQGIEFHQASNANMITSGCIGIARDQWQRFRQKTLDFVRRNGKAFLNVNPDGSASITAQRPVAGGEGQGGSLGSGFMPGAGGNAAALAKSATPTAESLAKTVPMNNAKSGLDNVSRGGGGGPAVHAPISISGGNSDPETLANLVQKRLQDTLNTRTHDQSYRSI